MNWSAWRGRRVDPAEKDVAWLAGHSKLAIVLGASVNGLSFARSLGRRGIHVLLLDSEKLIGFHTKYARSVLLPSARENPEAWVDWFSQFGRKLQGPIPVFATSDEHNVFLAEHGGRLESAFRYLVPDLITMNRIVNKRLQYGVAAAAGVPIPNTFYPESAVALDELLNQITFPCILKPYRAHVGRAKISNKKVLKVDSADELRAAFESLWDAGAEFMVQEIVPGTDKDLFGYLAFWDENSEEIRWLTKQKLRQNPPLFGDGSLQRTVEAPEVAEQSRRLLKALDYRGFVGVEFKRDSRDGTFRLMEVNPRTVSGNQMAISAGVDFPWIGFQYLTERELDPPASEPFQEGVVYCNEEWDFKAFLALRRQGDLTFSKWWKSFRSADARAIGAKDDPRPMLAVLGRFVRAGLRSLLRQRSAADGSR